jgi:excisionase family DNA binding protein
MAAADSTALTVVEAAARLRVNRQTLYRIIWAGEIAWINVAKPGAQRARIRIRESAIEAFLNAREQPGRAA